MNTPQAASIICTDCGVPNPADETFCKNCGAILQQAGVTPAQVTLAPNTAVPASSPTQFPQAQDAIPTSGLSIGIWGPRSSGKTMYLYMLQAYITNLPGHEWRMRSHNEAAKKLLNMATNIFEHRFPLPTTTPHPEECLFRFTKAAVSGPDKEYFMRVLDVPGELYENPDKAVDSAGNNFLEAYLRDCSGLLCFVDPDQGEDEPMLRFLRVLLNDLAHSQEFIEKRFAFCLTKMDSPRHRRYLPAPEAYIRQKLGSQMVKAIERTCAPGNVRFNFACSAVGFYHHADSGVLFRNVDNTQHSNSGIDWYGRPVIYDTKHIQPINLFDPLKWLFDDSA